MDEPSAPLTMTEVEAMFEVVETLREQGVTVIYISHRMEEIFHLGDRVSILRDGQYVATRDVADTNRAELITLMVGRELSETFPERTHAILETFLLYQTSAGAAILCQRLVSHASSGTLHSPAGRTAVFTWFGPAPGTVVASAMPPLPTCRPGGLRRPSP